MDSFSRRIVRAAVSRGHVTTRAARGAGAALRRRRVGAAAPVDASRPNTLGDRLALPAVFQRHVLGQVDVPLDARQGPMTRRLLNLLTFLSLLLCVAVVAL